jgi:hypothetical protein
MRHQKHEAQQAVVTQPASCRFAVSGKRFPNQFQPRRMSLRNVTASLSGYLWVALTAYVGARPMVERGFGVGAQRLKFIAQERDQAGIADIAQL